MHGQQNIKICSANKIVICCGIPEGHDGKELHTIWRKMALSMSEDKITEK
jgi:hypothetical protein